MWDGWVDIERPRIHILGHWNYAAGTRKKVYVVSSAERVELRLNGKSLGRKKKIFEGSANQQINGQPAYRIRWDDVIYAPGELKVVAYKAGKEWATDTVKTTGPATQLFLKPDRASIAGDGHDLSFVTLTVAGALALNIASPKASSSLAAGATITASGTLKVQASTTYHTSALADATPVTSAAATGNASSSIWKRGLWWAFPAFLVILVLLPRLLFRVGVPATTLALLLATAVSMFAASR